MKMKAAVVREKGGSFSIEEVELHDPKEGEVLVRIVASGVCHTDAVARDQLIPIPLPAILGHEGAGIVEKVGKGVTSVQPGDHVVLSYASCGQCENCLAGHPSLCTQFVTLNFLGKMSDDTHRIQEGGPSGRFISTFFGQSSFATYAVAHERNVVKVDKEVDLTLLGPLGCGIQTGSGTVLNKLRPEFGSSIAVYGCGAVGLSAVMAAKIAGCAQIIAVDIHQNRLDLALELGATHALNSKDVDLVEEIRKITKGGSHYGVETTGVATVVRQAAQALRTRGTLAIVGVTGEVTFNVNDDIMSQGKTLVGVIEGDAVPQLFIPKLIEYYKAGQFPFDKLIKFYSFEQINEAFADSEKGLTIKPVITMGG